MQSVFAQTHKNWEIILVDDGSVEDCSNIARRYAERYPKKVFYFEHTDHKNQGASASRQLAIQRARGDFLALLDADDIWMPLKLEQQLAILDSNTDAVMIYGNTQYWYSWTGNPADRKRDYFPNLGVKTDILINPPTLLLFFLEGKAAVPCTCSILVKRKIVEALGGFEDAFVNLYDDQVFYTKICLEAPVFVANQCWDKYRQHPDSLCAVASRKQNQYARDTYLKWLYNYLSEKTFQNNEVWKVLKKEMWLNRQPTWINNREHASSFVRWAKKWFLRLGERILPASLQKLYWFERLDH
jgi:glycosyltransferase involved in cell wall biosynthesis